MTAEVASPSPCKNYAFPLSAVGSSAGCFNFLAASFLYSVRDVM